MYHVASAEVRALALARAIRDETTPIPPEAVYRPMQYLGSKVRSLEAITRVVEAMAPNGVVADLGQHARVDDMRQRHAPARSSSRRRLS